MSQGLGIYNTLLLPCRRSRLLQRRGRVFACRSSDLGSIPGWGRYNIFALRHKVSREITKKESMAELPLLHSACQLMLIDICIQFCEYSLNGC